MANYSITNPQARLSLVRLVEIPQVAAPPPPWLAVSPDPGPVLADVPPRVGGQPGAWQAPLTIQRSPVGVPVGIREAAIASLPPAGYANGTGFLEGLTASLPDLTVNGIATGLRGNTVIPVAAPSTDISTAVDISSFEYLGAFTQTWAAQSVPAPTSVTGNAGDTSSTPYALGTLPSNGIEVTGNSITSSWDWDYYSFVAPADGPVMVYFECLTAASGANLSCTLKTTSQSQLNSFTSGQTACSVDLVAGTTYLIHIFSNSGPLPAPYVFRLAPLTQPAHYYRFTTTRPGRFRLYGDCSDRAAGIIAVLRNLSGSSSRTITGTGSLNSDSPQTGQSLRFTSYPAGDWYITTRVNSPGGGSLAFSGFFKPFPGSDLASAWDLGTLPDGGSLTWEGQCSSALADYDDFGYFRFRTTAAGSRILRGVTSQISNSYYAGYCTCKIWLYSSDGGTTIGSTTSGSLTRTLAANTDYLIYFSLDWAYAYAVGRCVLTFSIT